ncbi:hypothetical protein pb186bvf_019623 [Paramecium bursaria]
MSHEEKQRSKSVLHIKYLQRIQGQFSDPAQLSASILQQSVSQVTFPKAERFKSPKNDTSASSRITQLQDTKTKRSCSFGYGSKMTQPLAQQKKDLLNPAPNAYDFRIPKSVAHTFGIRPIGISKNLIPGPGSYNATKFNRSPHFTIYPKLQDVISNERFPNFQSYNPQEKLVKNQRFQKIGLGIGERFKIICKQDFPGPGQYNQPSKFDKKSKKVRN